MSLPSGWQWFSIQQIGAGLREGQFTSEDLTAACIGRIEAHEPSLNAYISVTKALAEEQAAQADKELRAGNVRSPLHGVPVAVKDLLVTAGVPTTFASKAYEHYVTDYDATVVARLREAGAVLVGKTNLSEGAADSSSLSSAFGGPANPWNPDMITGGSSGGSAAAVAAGTVFGAVGSDTAMSIRQPAALCGIVGLKPSFGRVSKHGAMALAFSLDHLGPMTRSVADAATMLQAMAGFDAADPTSSSEPVPDYTISLREPIDRIRIAVARQFLEGSDSQWIDATERAVAILEEQGAEVVDVNLPRLQDLLETGQSLVRIEGAAFHAARFREVPELFGPGLAGLIRVGNEYSGVQYVQLQRIRRLASEEFRCAFAGFDALVLPTTPEPACLIPDDDPASTPARMRNTMPFNALGLPAITVPAGLDSRNMPIGVQFVAQPFSESRLLQIAYAYEQALGLEDFHPPALDALAGSANENPA